MALSLVTACEDAVLPPRPKEAAPLSAQVDGEPLAATGSIGEATMVAWGPDGSTLALSAWTHLVIGPAPFTRVGDGVRALIKLDPYEVLGAAPGTTLPIRAALEVLPGRAPGDSVEVVLHPEQGHSPAVRMVRLVHTRAGQPNPGLELLSQRVFGELRIDEASFSRVRAHLALRAEVSEAPGPDATEGHARSCALAGNVDADWAAPPSASSSGSLEIEHGGQRFTWWSDARQVGFWGGGAPFTLRVTGFARVDGALEPDGSTWFAMDFTLPASMNMLERGVYDLDPPPDGQPRELVVLRHQEQITPAEQMWRGQIEVLSNNGSAVLMKARLVLDGFGEVQFRLLVPHDADDL